MNAPCVHLFSGGELAGGHRYHPGGLVAVCGEPVSAPGVPCSSCPDECAHQFCPDCVREAARWSAEAGQESILRRVVQLADDMPQLTDTQLRERLAALEAAAP